MNRRSALKLSIAAICGSACGVMANESAVKLSCYYDRNARILVVSGSSTDVLEMYHRFMGRTWPVGIDQEQRKQFIRKDLKRIESNIREGKLLLCMRNVLTRNAAIHAAKDMGCVVL